MIESLEINELQVIRLSFEFMDLWNGFVEVLSKIFTVEVFSALLTPVIAGITVYIARQQWKTNHKQWETNHNKLKLDLYERRLKIYEEVWKFISLIIRDGNVTTKELQEFYSATMEADFLFGDEIREYINEIYKHGIDLRLWSIKIKDQNNDEAADKENQELIWFYQQLEPAKKRFKEYLHIPYADR
jgi:hypothetical protein